MQTDTVVNTAELEEHMFESWAAGQEPDPAIVQEYFICMAIKQGDYELAKKLMETPGEVLLAARLGTK